MEDLWKSLRVYLYEKSTSPLSGAFIISWLVWNYRVFIILFSGDHYDDRFAAIDDYFFEAWIFETETAAYYFGRFFHGLVGPAILVIVYVFIYPLIAAPVYQFTLATRTNLRKIRQAEEKKRRLTVEESQEILRRSAQREAEHRQELEFANKQIDSFDQENKELKEQLAAISATSPEIDDGPARDTELDDLESEMDTSVFIRGEGEFKVENLFPAARWSDIHRKKRLALETLFKSKIARGDYPEVKFSKNDALNVAIYQKSPKKP